MSKILKEDLAQLAVWELTKEINLKVRIYKYDSENASYKLGDIKNKIPNGER